MERKIRVLITDAGYKHTLGAIRSLGKRGFFIIAMSSNKMAQSFFSCYCNEKLICPNPRNERDFMEFLINYLKKIRLIYLTIGYMSTVIISRHKEELNPYVKIPVADYKIMEIASNKEKTMQLAKKLNIPIPTEYTSINEIERFPIVAKGIFESGQIRYINSIEELNQIDFNNYILQEYIPGDGYGFYALFNQGILKAYFMHKRVREYPITGGASTCAESYYDENLKEAGLKLLESLGWHGVAMVEFKKDSMSGEFKLMEINPKFWGSLDLSIESGIDFPFLSVKMTLDGDVEPAFHYKNNVRFRWPFPDDVFHFFANPKSIFEIIIESFQKNTKSNIWLRDFLPNIIQIWETLCGLLSRIVHGNLRYPHSKPK